MTAKIKQRPPTLGAKTLMDMLARARRDALADANTPLVDAIRAAKKEADAVIQGNVVELVRRKRSVEFASGYDHAMNDLYKIILRLVGAAQKVGVRL